MKKKIWFVSRHEPTEEQRALVPNFDLVKVDDIDGFDYKAVHKLMEKADAEGVEHFAVVNAALALNIISWYAGEPQYTTVVVFENASRPAEGGKPTFTAKAAHAWTCGFGSVWRASLV